MEYDSTDTAYQLQRSAVRRLVRRAYLRSEREQLLGTTLDFGCGVGDLLAMLPQGSMGLEYNHATVAHCCSLGLDVSHYDGFADDWSLSVLPAGRCFESMAICHVLEHLDAPMHILNRLLAAAEGLGVKRVLVAVPGKAGFESDSTHLTFVDRHMLEAREVVEGTKFRIANAKYFPGDLRRIGDSFVHHELQALFTRG